jgi:hypothetical protein
LVTLIPTWSKNVVDVVRHVLRTIPTTREGVSMDVRLVEKGPDVPSPTSVWDLSSTRLFYQVHHILVTIPMMMGD